MSKCNICKKTMDTGAVADKNCGGDCLICMAASNDGDCQHELNEDLLAKVYAFVNEQTKDWPEGVDYEARQYLTEIARFWRSHTT